MSWYFLPRDLLPSIEVLRAYDITFTDTEIHEPGHAIGYAFYLEHDEMLRELLDAMGFAETKFKNKPTNIEGIALLIPSGSRKSTQPTETTLKRAAEDPTGFLEMVTTQRAAELAGHRTAELTAAADLEMLREQFVQSATKLRDLGMQRQLLDLSDELFAQTVKTECEKMGQNPRVQNIRYGKNIILVQTTALTIEQRGEPTRLIGQLGLTINLLDASIRIEAIQPLGPTAHPNVMDNGYLMLGPLRDAFIRYLGSRQYSTALKLITDLLSAAPKTDELRNRLRQWPAAA